ncbi:hypothetical protein [Nocardia transvalensis]|uniref:hypothetical protein n=1 Tax=Nocardia transvalensis TaxID=37333 RepID=UPI001893FED6|nr:hypothetical protein [Nocardia transvalensis]MBF6333348.1 hypothetical protein [Nocardia transvalensis]
MVRCCDEYNRLYGLGAKVWSGTSIYTLAGAVHVVAMDKPVGVLARQELRRCNLRAPIMVSAGVVRWLFVVRGDLDVQAHIDLHTRLLRRPGSPVTISAPGNYITFPAPGKGRKHWVDKPVDADRPRLSVVYKIAETALGRVRGA